MYVVGITLADLHHPAAVAGNRRRSGAGRRRGHLGGAGRHHRRAGSTSTSRPRRISRRTGGACSRCGQAAWASGAASPRARPAGVWRVRRAGASVGGVHGRDRPGAAGRPGRRPHRQLLQPGAVRQARRTLPWGLEISPPHRPAGYEAFTTFQPTFLYELIFDLALAAALVWLGHHRRIRPPGLFALYVDRLLGVPDLRGVLRIDSSEHFLGLRLNTYIAAVLAIAGIVWFVVSQRRQG